MSSGNHETLSDRITAPAGTKENERQFQVQELNALEEAAANWMIRCGCAFYAIMLLVLWIDSYVAPSDVGRPHWISLMFIVETSSIALRGKSIFLTLRRRLGPRRRLFPWRSP